MNPKYRLTAALLAHWEHPNSGRNLRFLYFALFRARYVVNAVSVCPDAVAWWWRVTGHQELECA